MDRKAEIQRTVEQIVRRGRGQLVADLVRRLGPARLDVAEDVAHEAILLALKQWPYHTMPEVPLAWLRRVGLNKAVDRLRREGREMEWVESFDKRVQESPYLDSEIVDPELRLLFLVCQHVHDARDRHALMLSIAGGFTAKEIASLFIESESATSQRLSRAKRKYRLQLPEREISLNSSKLRVLADSVLKGIYLSFALGYAPRKGERLLRSDVCYEALRLSRLIADDPQVTSSQAKALAALLCFHTARLAAREGPGSNVVLLKDQDRYLWDPNLIAEGHIRLAQSQEDGTLSQFHIEAGLSALHSVARNWAATNWNGLVRLYRVLVARHNSPIASLGLAVALAEMGDAETALTALNELNEDRRMPAFGPFHMTRAHVLSLVGQHEAARTALARASECDASAPIETFIAMRITEFG